MRDTIDMAREAGARLDKHNGGFIDQSVLLRFEALVRADAIAGEREQGQKWFDAVTAQHKAEILAEREACAKFADESLTRGRSPLGPYVADAIRARGETK